MASSTGLICSECQMKGNTSAANTWCPECCKSLCTSCKKQHDRSNASINHKTIPADVYQNLHTFVTNLSVHCDKHKIKYEKYCPDHQLLLCKKCVASAHKTCKGLMSLDQVTKNINSSVAIENMKKSIDCIQLKIENMRQNRNDNLTSVRKQIKDIQKQISNFRSRLNKTLDNMEKELINEMEKVEKKTASHLTILFKDLQEHENKIEEMKRGIEGLEKHGTDFQTFLAGNQIEIKMHQEEGYLQSLLNKKFLENIIIKYNTDSNLQTFLSENVNFGNISVETIPSDILVFRGNVREIQQPVRSHFSQLLIAQRFRMKPTEGNVLNVAAMCLLPNMDMVFIGHQTSRTGPYRTYDTSRLIVHDSEGLLKYSFNLHYLQYFHDVTAVDDRTVAIVYKPISSSIEFIDILKQKVIKIVSGFDFSTSLSKSNEVLYFTEYCEGVKKVSLLDYSITSFYHSTGCPFSYVATLGNKICYTEPSSDQVTLLNSASNVLWKYKDAILRCPMKATFDKRGNIYVVGQSTYNVVFISHDGKQSRQVLSKEDGITNTMSIDFDLNRNRLIVVSFLGDVVIYNCS